MAKELKVVKPIILHDEETGEEYTLEFTRKSVQYAESRGFTLGDAEKMPMTRTIDFFWYAFRAHHPTVSREKAETILFDKLGGMSTKLMDRLGELYTLPYQSLAEGDDENPKMTVEL